MELLLIDTGLLPDDKMALKLASKTTKKIIKAIIIPVMVARVYLRKFFILKQINGMNFKYIKTKRIRKGMHVFDTFDIRLIW
jgi:hypothetical protein